MIFDSNKMNKSFGFFTGLTGRMSRINTFCTTAGTEKKTPSFLRTGFANEMWLYYLWALLEALSGLIFIFFSVVAVET
jgi:hypothetical protein